METLYHAVAILSCRSETLQELPRSSPTYILQNLSGTRVTEIVGQDFHGQLSLLPIVPYAVSLALRVAYRELRFSKVPMLHDRARKQFVANCAILRELGELYWGALVMAELGEHTLPGFEKDRWTGPGDSDERLVSGADGDNSANTQPTSGTASSRGLGRQQIAREEFPMHAEALVQEEYGGSALDWMVLDNAPDLDFFGWLDPDFEWQRGDAHPASSLPSSI